MASRVKQGACKQLPPCCLLLVQIQTTYTFLNWSMHHEGKEQSKGTYFSSRKQNEKRSMKSYISMYPYVASAYPDPAEHNKESDSVATLLCCFNLHHHKPGSTATKCGPSHGTPCLRACPLLSLRGRARPPAPNPLTTSSSSGLLRAVTLQNGTLSQSWGMG